jgi:hypothetical protein
MLNLRQIFRLGSVRRVTMRRMAWIGVVSLLATSACGRADPLPAAAKTQRPITNIQTADSAVRSVEHHGSDLIIKLFYPSEPDTGDFVSMAAGSLQNIGRRIKAGAPDAPISAKRLLISVTSRVKNRLGEERDAPVFGASYSISDLRKARYENLTAGDVLGLATDVYATKGAGEIELQTWCAQRANLAPHFCQTAARDRD